MLKLLNESKMRNRILHSLKLSFYKMFIDYKGKENNSTMEKPNTHHLNQVFKVNTASIGTNQCHVPPDGMQ